MQSQEATTVSSSKLRKSHTICCYNVDQNEDDDVDHNKRFFEKPPMLVRDIASKIRFKNLQPSNRQPIYELLNDLYESSNPSAVYAQLSGKRINPVIHGGEERDDLEYYIPQLVTYMVLEKNLEDEELMALILKGCATDFYFAHRIYFYLKSLSTDNNSQSIASVEEFLTHNLVQRMQIYQNSRLSGLQFTRSMLMMDGEFKGKRLLEELEGSEQAEEEQLVNNQGHQAWRNYATIRYPTPSPESPPPIRRVIRKRYCSHGFMETPKFWQDLLQIGSRPQLNNQSLDIALKEVNQRLPGNVYIPFFKEEIRLCTVLCLWKGRLFSTNTRTPYAMWAQVYRQEEEVSLSKVQELGEEEEDSKFQGEGKKNFLQKIYEKISKPFSISGDKNTLNIKRFLTEKISAIQDTIKHKSKDRRSVTGSFVETRSRNLSLSEVYVAEEREARSEGRDSQSASSVSEVQNEEFEANPQERMVQFFGHKSEDFIKQIRERSIYRDLKSWRLVHLMVKTGDDIKQEQFAMQLISRFQYAFRRQKLQCVVFPYEVISLGPDCGIIEMLNDITTLDSLFQKLRNRGLTLRQFFDKVFPNPVEARRNFMRSLAGYSILTYFLQVKDRHNGNILLSREGYIIHIDFGFFLSNAPGRGVELERKVPFKLLREYVDVIGDLNSEQFFEFRQLFYRGFNAVLKHKEAILTLVKLMYSSHRDSMGCFIRGAQAIEELEQRFSIEGRVQSFCYDLINSSLDNWRARWYDKFQYFLQKIYY